MKFIPQCFTRLVQLLHEEPTADSDSDTDSDSPTTHSDSEEAGAADEHEQQPTQQRSRFAAASAPSAPRMAVPPLVVLLQPLLQFIAPFHKQVVEATAVCSLVHGCVCCAHKVLFVSVFALVG